MMAERGIAVDHATVHRWVVRYSSALLERFNLRKRAVGGKWYMDETYIKVRGQWMYPGDRQSRRHGRVLVQ
jgi:transposase-like protein